MGKLSPRELNNLPKVCYPLYVLSLKFPGIPRAPIPLWVACHLFLCELRRTQKGLHLISSQLLPLGARISLRQRYTGLWTPWVRMFREFSNNFTDSLWDVVGWCKAQGRTHFAPPYPKNEWTWGCPSIPVRMLSTQPKTQKLISHQH